MIIKLIILTSIFLMASNMIIYDAELSELKNDIQNEKNLEERLAEINIYLKNDPSNIELLLEKANLLSVQKNFSEAISLYDSILEMDNNNLVAKNKLSQAAQNFRYIPIEGIFKTDGIFEMIVRDKNGKLINYQQSHKIFILDHQIAINHINSWDSMILENNNGTETIVLQKEQFWQPRNDKPISQYVVRHPDNSELFLLRVALYQTPVEPGDQILFKTKIFIPS